jgi:hypothetical protein
MELGHKEDYKLGSKLLKEKIGKIIQPRKFILLLMSNLN